MIHADNSDGRVAVRTLDQNIPISRMMYDDPLLASFNTPMDSVALHLCVAAFQKLLVDDVYVWNCLHSMMERYSDILILVFACTGI